MLPPDAQSKLVMTLGSSSDVSCLESDTFCWYVPSRSCWVTFSTFSFRDTMLSSPHHVTSAPLTSICMCCCNSSLSYASGSPLSALLALDSAHG